MARSGLPLRPGISKALYKLWPAPCSLLPAQRGEVGFNIEPALVWVELTRIYYKRLTWRAEQMDALSLISPFFSNTSHEEFTRDLLIPGPPS